MEAFEIESQTDQTPLAGSRRNPTHRELAETEHLFDNREHRFDGAFAGPEIALPKAVLSLYASLTWGLASWDGGAGSGAKR
jgi:hypothetical protein